jgi:hypothetical protein
MIFMFSSSAVRCRFFYYIIAGNEEIIRYQMMGSAC